MKIELTIFGDPRTKKNHQRVIMTKGRPRIIQSKAYLTYEKEAKAQLLTSIKMMDSYFPIKTPVNVKAVYYRLTRRRVDITNLEAALMDVLVKAGVLEDDNCNIVVSTDGSRVKYDKTNPRTEIVITEAEKTEKPNGF